MSQKGQEQTIDIPREMSFVRVMEDIFQIHEKDKLFTGE